MRKKLIGAGALILAVGAMAGAAGSAAAGTYQGSGFTCPATRIAYADGYGVGGVSTGYIKVKYDPYGSTGTTSTTGLNTLKHRKHSGGAGSSTMFPMHIVGSNYGINGGCS